MWQGIVSGYKMSITICHDQKDLTQRHSRAIDQLSSYVPRIRMVSVRAVEETTLMVGRSGASLT